MQLISAQVQGAVESSEAAGFTPSAFLLVARAVLSADGHCVSRTDILRLLKAHDSMSSPEATLQALVGRNVVSVRPFSRWASDIPATAFGKCKKLVVAPSAAHLHCWKTDLPPLIQVRPDPLKCHTLARSLLKNEGVAGALLSSMFFYQDCLMCMGLSARQQGRAKAADSVGPVLQLSD